MKRLIIGSAVLLSGCIVEPARTYYPAAQNYYPQDQQYQQSYPQQYPQPDPQQYQQPYPQQYQQPYPQQSSNEYPEPVTQPVVSVYVDPPLVQPAPVLVAWAPPPMLVESPPPMPYDGAIWTGGYWVWEGNWVWAHGRWAAPPQPGYSWVNPYYENRHGSVVFVNGFWAAPGVTFVAPPLGISIALGIVAAGVIAGPRCHGPEGVFVPPPPGSHRGLIVPAPVGTAPAVVTSAPPVVNQGMRIAAINNGRGGHNVTIVAPSGATANGQAVNRMVPGQPHLAAAMNPVVHAYAPDPVSSRPIPAYVAGRQPAVLPGAQPVSRAVGPAFNQPHMNNQQPAPYGQPGGRQTNVPVMPENRYEPVESKPWQVEQKPQQIEHRPQQVEQRPQQYEQRPQQYDQRPQQYEQRPQQYEQRPQQFEQKPQQFQQQMQQPQQQKSNPAPEPKFREKKPGSEKKPENERERER